MNEEPHLPQLTDREMQIIPGIVDGKSYREIALLLNIAESTVKIRLINIFDKLGISTRLELVYWCARRSCDEHSRRSGLE